MPTKVGDMYAELNLKKDKFEKNLQSSEKRIQKFSANAKVALQALAIAAAAVAAELYRATKAAMEQEKSVRSLTSILTDLKLATREEIDALIDYSKAIQLTTAYSDEEAQSAMAMLGTFQLTAKQINEIMPRLLDMASSVSMIEGRHISLVDAAKRFGMAMNDNVGLLKRWGVVLNEEAIAADRYNGMLISIDENYKGQAKTYITTTEGAMKRMKNMYTELEESLGQGLLPYLREYIKLLTEDMMKADGLTSQLKDIGSWIGRTGIIVMRVVNWSRQAMSELGAHITNFALGIVRLAEKIPGLGGKFEGIRSSIQFLNIGFREQTKALRENDLKYKQMIENLRNYTDSTEEAYGAVTTLNTVTREADPIHLLALETWQREQKIMQDLKEEMREYIESLRKNKEATIDWSEVTRVAAENTGEMFATMIQSGADTSAVLKRLIGQLIRMAILSKLGPIGAGIGGFMRIFGFQHGGITNMPMINMRPDLAIANENPNVPEVVAPLDAKKLQGLFQVNVHSADPGTTVDIVLKGLDDKRADQLIRNVVNPALSRDARR